MFMAVTCVLLIRVQKIDIEPYRYRDLTKLSSIYPKIHYIFELHGIIKFIICCSSHGDHFTNCSATPHTNRAIRSILITRSELTLLSVQRETDPFVLKSPHLLFNPAVSKCMRSVVAGWCYIQPSIISVLLQYIIIYLDISSTSSFHAQLLSFTLLYSFSALISTQLWFIYHLTLSEFS